MERSSRRRKQKKKSRKTKFDAFEKEIGKKRSADKFSFSIQIIEMLLLRGKRTTVKNSSATVSVQATQKTRHYRLTPGLRGVTPLQLAASYGSSSTLVEMMYSRETFAGLDMDQIKGKKEFFCFFFSLIFLLACLLLL
jgi:hypothetical protein